MSSASVVSSLLSPYVVYGILAVFLGALMMTDPSTSISQNKPYSSFSDFYGFYLFQHSESGTKICHIIGTSFLLLFCASKLLLVPALATAVVIGLSLTPILRGHDNGLYEFAIVILVYVVAGYAGTKSLAWTIAPVIIAYAFAWVGHFFIEDNRPATFIYPTYSLLGDIRMYYDVMVSRQIPL